MQAIIQQLQAVKQASYGLSLISEAQRNQVLLSLAKQLRASWQQIIVENAKDLALMEQDDPKYDRLLLTKERVYALAADIESVTTISHPDHAILEEKKLANGLIIQKRRVPLGVVAVIYEARPNVTIDIFSLCFKSGNACVLKGGKEAYHSNSVLVELINLTLAEHRIDSNILCLLPNDHAALNTLLTANKLVDVCIPRGGQELINFVRQNARIPIIETGAGIVHTYFDYSGDAKKGALIVNNAKTRRVSVCNALDTLIIHEQRLPDLIRIVALLAAKNVTLLADERSYITLLDHYPAPLLQPAKPNDFGCEFLAYKMSIKTVASVAEAVKHIMQYTSFHSEAIISEDQAAIDYFLNNVDAAAIYVNASTAFTDGGQFGMGAEIGISTQKLHARGPMALDALTSYKWVVFGSGHIRN